jgi:hypothetical protein
MASLPNHQSHQLQQLVQGFLQGRLQERGYVYLPQFNQFRRLTPAGFQSVILNWTPHQDACILEVQLGIRHDAVEDIASPFTNGLTGFQAQSLTLVTPMAKLYDEPSQRFTLRNAQDAQAAAEAIAERLFSRGVGFLEKYSRLEAVDSLFNAKPAEPVSFVHNQFHRCLKALAIARLNFRADFERLAVAYRVQLQNIGASEVVLERYDRLLRYLRTYAWA